MESQPLGARPSWAWLAVVVPLVVLSIVRIEMSTKGLSWSVQATPVTAALVAIGWLPALLQLLAARGGTVSAAGLSIGLEPLRRLGAARADPVADGSGGDDADGSGGSGDELAAPPPQPPPLQRAVAKTLRELETSFQALLTRLPASFPRTAALESVLAEARVLAPEAAGNLAARVSTMVDDPEARRAVTLALLQGAPAPLPEQTGAALADSLARNRSSFEEYHLLRTIRDRYADLSPGGRSRVVSAVGALLGSGRFPSDGDRRGLARQIALLSVGSAIPGD